MKILFCIDRYLPSRGGAERYLQDLVEALHRLGHIVTVAAFKAEGDGLARIVLLKAPAFPRLLREIAFSRKAARLSREGGFDRVVGFRHVLAADRFQPHEGLFLDALRGSVRPASGRPLIRTLLFTRKLLSPKNLFFLLADRLLLRGNPGLKVAALSERMAGTIRHRYGPWKPEVTVIPHGAETGRYHPGLRHELAKTVRFDLGLSPSQAVVLFCGHNFRLKGLREGIRGFAEYCRSGVDACMLVAGRGKAGPHRTLARKSGVEEQVRFLGEVSAMERLYAVADVLLHPTYYDPCSLVVLEALGAGVPVVTSVFNGAAELMREGKGGVVIEDPRDAEALANALGKVLCPADRARYREEAARLGSCCNFQRHMEKMAQWITAV